MFSKTIVDSDAFMDMPQSSQLLYFHLCMRADDEGFVGNPKRIIRMVGSNDDDYKILLAKSFVIPFESGVCVIKHWLIHNTIRMDRFAPTNYQEEKSLLNTKENKAYTLGKPNGNQMETQVKLSKVNLTKDKLIYGEFKNVFLEEEEHIKLLERFGVNNTHILIEELSGYLASTNKKYASHYATILNWARRKVQDRNQKLEAKKRTII